MNSNQKALHDSKVIADGKQVFTAVAFIHQLIDGVEKVFLAKRADTKKFLPGVYELPGGHIDFGEDMVEGLKREIREELDVDIHVGDPFYVFTYVNEIKESHSIEVIYFARFADAQVSVQLNPSDHSAYGWFAESDLDPAVLKKSSDDPEMSGILQGFSILKGNPLDAG